MAAPTSSSGDDVLEGGNAKLMQAVLGGKSPRISQRPLSNVDSPSVSAASEAIIDKLFAAARGRMDQVSSVSNQGPAWRSDMPSPVGVDLSTSIAPSVPPARVSVTPFPKVSMPATTVAVDSSSSSSVAGAAVLGNKGFAIGSYAAALRNVDSSDGNNLSYFPLNDKKASKIELPSDLIKQASVTYQNTLYGYFLGPRLYFPNVVKEVKKLWSKMGFQEAMMNDNGFLFFRFSSIDGMRQVMEGGPWMIRGVPLFVFPWDPMQGLVKPEHKTCPLWVKLHNIPLVAFNREGVARIASALGEPKMMDDFTANMCANAWGRPGFAKVLVDVWAVGELKRELDVVVPNLYGGKGTEVTIRVEYLWEPTQCTHCSVFGHKVSSCVKATVTKAVIKGKGKAVVDVDGFTTVQNRKHKGIVINDQPLKQVKPKQVYVPVTPKLVDVNASTVVETPPVSAVLSSTVSSSTIVEPTPASVPVSVGGEAVTIPPVLEQASVPVSQSVGGNLNVDPDFSAYSNLRDYLTKKGQSFPVSNVFSSLANLNTDDLSTDLDDSPSFGIWNIRGLNASIKQREVRFFIQSSGLALCVILESHVGVPKLREITSSVFGSWSWVSNQIHCTQGVRILIGWNPILLDVMVVSMTDQVVHCKILLTGSSKSLYASFVYGSNNMIARRALWADLCRFSTVSLLTPWLVSGDFNAILSPAEQLGGSPRRDIRMEEFVDCVEATNLFDL
ncbi:hypothetical protein OSB04_031864 [Centaurea solstitialis]|uniref:DUF4283 domain-containing protein n=1 Tax=Centaurea solstitialis TaxID=347529 RepID=A0AA38SNH8_9ASTR|nr:hypothetical protein OSB04_031864 [Centaurea solstitialis]